MISTRVIDYPLSLWGQQKVQQRRFRIDSIKSGEVNNALKCVT